MCGRVVQVTGPLKIATVAEELLGDAGRGDFGNEDLRRHPTIARIAVVRRELIAKDKQGAISARGCGS